MKLLKGFLEEVTFFKLMNILFCAELSFFAHQTPKDWKTAALFDRNVSKKFKSTLKINVLVKL